MSHCSYSMHTCDCLSCAPHSTVDGPQACSVLTCWLMVRDAACERTAAPHPGRLFASILGAEYLLGCLSKVLGDVPHRSLCWLHHAQPTARSRVTKELPQEGIFAAGAPFGSVALSNASLVPECKTQVDTVTTRVQYYRGHHVRSLLPVPAIKSEGLYGTPSALQRCSGDTTALEGAFEARGPSDRL